MPVAPTSTPIACTRDPLSSIDTDLVIVPWFDDEAAGAVPGVDGATGGELARALAAKEFPAKAYELFATPSVDRAFKPRRLAFIGAGKRPRASGRGKGACHAWRSRCAGTATWPSWRRRRRKD
jgi:hypothetical protein